MMKHFLFFLAFVLTVFNLSAQKEDILKKLGSRTTLSKAIPSGGVKISAVQEDPGAGGIIYGEFAPPSGTLSDVPAVWGINNVEDYYGVGVKGSGGFIGVLGEVFPTGNNVYFGTFGQVGGGTGINYGIYGEAFGEGTNYGVYASARGEGTNYGVYAAGFEEGSYGIYGINNAAGGYAGFFDGQVSMRMPTTNSAPPSFLTGLNMEVTGNSFGFFSGISLRYSDLANEGAALFFSPFGDGINVGNVIGDAFYPINASNIVAPSPLTQSDEKAAITNKEAGSFMDQIRKIEFASFQNATLTKSGRSTPRIGVISRSLPKELQVEMPSTPSKRDGQIQTGVSLTDWLGLVTIGVKENDRRMQEMIEENEVLKAENAALQERMDLLEANAGAGESVQALKEEVQSLRSLVEKLLARDAPEPAGSSYVLPLKEHSMLAQNQPNPFHQNTVIEYFIPGHVKDARIQVTSAEGQVLGTVEIGETGQGQLTIQSNSYPPGTYFYSLILDGQVQETRRMVLTR